MKHLRLLLLFLVLAMATDLSAWKLSDETGQILEIGGHMQYRGRYYNLDFNSDSERGSLNRHNFYGDLSLDFKLTPNEYVTAYLEFNRLIFLGQEFPYNTIQTGEDVLPQDFTLPDGVKVPLRRNTDESWEMHVRQAWMDIKFPGGIPMKMKFGRQGFILGNGIYTNTNISTVFGYQFYTDLGKDKPMFRFGSMKYFEGVREDFKADENTKYSDDVDIYFADLSAPAFNNGSKVGAFLSYYRDRSQDINRLTNVNLGLTANINLPRGWSMKGEFDYQNGNKDYLDNSNTDMDWTGYALMLGLNAPKVLNNKLALSAEFGIGSGDDPNTPDKFEGYVGVGPFYPYAWAYEYRFIHWIHNSSKFFAQHSYGMSENLAPGLENTTYFKVTGAVSLPHKCLWITSPIWLGMTEEGESFGWEYDNIFIAPIWKNFSYQFIFAAVFPSDYMKDRGLKDTAWGIRSQVEVKF